MVCDHFEPRHGIERDEQAFERVGTWQREYARFQDRCHASFGTRPLHTWFYPPHHGSEHLQALSDMVFEGLGEVELHYHHNGDTAETLRSALSRTLAEYNRWGLLLESGETPRQGFAFIHGDWALNNSRRGEFCGVNDEMTVLQELGCWADFTLPSGNICQTRKINSIYYASSDPDRPKAHNRGTDARVGTVDARGLMLLQGPLAINWRAPDHPRIENANLTTRNWGRPDRILKWLDCNIHVRGRPEWLFVKLHTHGAIERDFDALFGERAFTMHQRLNEHFNDGRRYRLHYVTARQGYNIVKAAENGERGSPSDWLDYTIGPQAHSYYALDAPHDLEFCTATRLTIANIASGRDARLRTRVGAVRRLTGKLRTVDLDASSGSIRLHTDEASPTTEVTLELSPKFELAHIDGGSVVSAAPGNRNLLLRVHRQCNLRYTHVRSDGCAPRAALR
jgi:hypothetical protein